MEENEREELLAKKLYELNELALRLAEEGKSLNTPELKRPDEEITKLIKDLK